MVAALWSLLKQSSGLLAENRLGSFWLLAQDEPKLPINRLDPITRTTVVMTLLGLVLLGLTVIVCIRLGGRWARRQGRLRSKERAEEKPLPSDWDVKG